MTNTAASRKPALTLGSLGSEASDLLRRCLLGQVAALLWAGLATTGGVFAARFGAAAYWGERKTPEGVRFAIATAPLVPRYWLDAASLDPDKAAAYLRKAVLLNRYHTGARTELALQLELQGDTRGAETELLTAAQYDWTAASAWSLANFYARRQSAEKFWPWSRRVALFQPWNAGGVFALNWRVSDQGDTILARGIPDRAEILHAYLRFLVDEQRWSAVEPAARKLFRHHPQQGGDLLKAVDGLLRAGWTAASLRIWDEMISQNLAARPPIGELLADSGFRQRPPQMAFGWRLWTSEAAQIRTLPPQPGLRIVFSGHQSLELRLLDQPVVLSPGRHYRLRSRQHSEGITSAAALQWALWEVFPERPMKDLVKQFPAISDSPLEWRFTVPEPMAVRITLQVRRLSGMMWPEGAIVLDEVSLREVESE